MTLPCSSVIVQVVHYPITTSCLAADSSPSHPSASPLHTTWNHFQRPSPSRYPYPVRRFAFFQFFLSFLRVALPPTRGGLPVIQRKYRPSQSRQLHRMSREPCLHSTTHPLPLLFCPPGLVGPLPSPLPFPPVPPLLPTG